MFISHLQLTDFRSWPELTVECGPGITVFAGPNGFGKTNIIESVVYLSQLSSHRVSRDEALVRAGSQFARVEATVVNGDRQLTEVLVIKPHAANVARLSNSPVQPKQLLGVVRAVLFSPEDVSLVRGDPDGRRQLIDAIIAQVTPRLGGVRVDYDRALRQRNALLKTLQNQRRAGVLDDAAVASLDGWDMQLARYGSELVHARARLVETLSPLFTSSYGQIAPHSVPASISYITRDIGADSQETEALLLTAFADHRRAEIEAGRTLIGPHRDDVAVQLGSQPAKGYASHGETWSLALALKAAVFRSLPGPQPILLLDDVFSELDVQRRTALTGLMEEAEQVLITTATPEDLPFSAPTTATSGAYRRFDVDKRDGISRLAAPAPDSQPAPTPAEDANG